MKKVERNSDIAKLTCLENGKVLSGEILDFKNAYSMTVSIERQVRVYMRWNTEKKMFIAKVGSLEFTSKGPEKQIEYKGR